MMRLAVTTETMHSVVVCMMQHMGMSTYCYVYRFQCSSAGERPWLCRSVKYLASPLDFISGFSLEIRNPAFREGPQQ